MFGAVIVHIGSSWSPIVTKLILRTPASEPLEAHVHCFGAFGDDGIFCDPSGG